MSRFCSQCSCPLSLFIFLFTPVKLEPLRCSQTVVGLVETSSSGASELFRQASVSSAIGMLSSEIEATLSALGRVIAAETQVCCRFLALLMLADASPYYRSVGRGVGAATTKHDRRSSGAVLHASAPFIPEHFLNKQ